MPHLFPYHLAIVLGSAAVSSHIAGATLDADAVFGALSGSVLAAWGWISLGRIRAEEARIAA